MSHVPSSRVVASSVAEPPGSIEPGAPPHRSLSDELSGQIGQQVRVMGWVLQVRRLKRVSFLIVRDRRGLTQVIVDDPTLMGTVEHLGNESVVTVTGVAIASSQAPGGVEVRATAVEVVSGAETPPFDLFRPALDLPLPTLLDHAPLSLRHTRRQAVLRVAAASVAGFRAALDTREFVAIQTPKLVEAAAEGGANVFPVSYFGRPAYLAQSPQLYKQIMVGVFERVYEVGPVFRAEPHDTPRHLNEYTSLDAEMGFIAEYRDVMVTLREVLAGMLG
ncbi:MAG: amino acid--tRNA ligase-related protein, partial [Thermomicrobiales bacterium]